MTEDIERQNRAFFDSDEIISRYKNDKQHIKRGERRILSRVVSADDRVLELGCGEGRVTEYLQQLCGSLTAVDVAPGMVSAAAERSLEAEFGVADASTLPFEDDTFDCVIFPFNGIDNVSPIERRQQTLREVRRVLRPGGHFVYTTHNKFWLPINPLKWWSYLTTHLLNGNVSRQYRETSLTEGSEEFTFYQFYADPRREQQRLRDAGFDVLAVEDESDSRLLKYIEPWLYYVCRSPA